MNRTILLSCLCTALVGACTSEPPPIYVTVAGHLEDDPRYTDCDAYRPLPQKLIGFADTLAPHDIPFRLQASYEWFTGTRLCEDAPAQELTGGMTSAEYLATQYGFAIDTHQEGASLDDATSGNNFADIRWAGEQVTTQMSEVTGFQWNNPSQYASLQAGESGLLHPEYTWKPEILAGGVSMEHTDGDFTEDMDALGIWIPSGFDEASFFQHDERSEARMVYVGSGPNQWAADWAPKPGCHYERTADLVEALSEQIERGDLPTDGHYTTTFFIPQKVMLDDTEWSKVTDNLAQLAPLVADGRVVYASYEDIVDDWRANGARPSVTRYDDLDASLRTCP